MRLAIDFDDTLGDSTPYFLEHLNKALGGDYTKEDFTSWNYHKALGLPEGPFWKFFHRVMDPASSYDIPPVDTAQEIIPELAEQHDLYVLTARQHKFQPYLRDWVEHYFPNQFRDVLTCGGQKEGIRKIHLMQRVNLDLLIDDSFKDFMSCQHEGKKSLLYTARHNVETPCSLRVDDWHEVKNLLRCYG